MATLQRPAVRNSDTNLNSHNSELSAEKLSTWIEVDLDAIVHNYRQVKTHVGEAVRVLAVVKANAYGHGAVEVSRALEAVGVDYLGVTRIEEGVELRHAGIQAPVLVFSPPIPDQIRDALKMRLTMTVDSLWTAEQISRAAQQRETAGQIGDHGKAPVHIKIDTGMGRLGLRAAEARQIIPEIQKLGRLQTEGLYTHFAQAADKSPEKTRRQLDRFLPLAEEFREEIPLIHAANSAALLRFPESHCGMVRTGTLLYGQYPDPQLPRHLKLRETFAWKARISAIRHLEPGDTVGYGSEWQARRSCLIATLPVGYAEGFGLEVCARTPGLREAGRKSFRALRSILRPEGDWRAVHFGAALLSVVGRIGMQQFCVLLPEDLEVSVGDIVTLPSRRLNVNPRIPRFYRESQ
ncbi:MAG: alanine racemase [Armatimonadetes bacterium]|nr:alanine racemase [Armatimonadota bacterium]